jgi:peptide/nickel transport system substrate-binding protein
MLTRRALVSKGVALGAGALSLPAMLTEFGGSALAAGAAPRRGGTMRVALAGMSTGDTLDPANAATTGAAAMCKQLYDTLAGYDSNGRLQLSLASEITAEKPDQWVVRLRDATWHNGRPVTADDVIHTFRRILTPKGGLYNAAEIAFIDPKRITKLDARTVRFKFFHGAMFFPDTLCGFNQAIVPVGFDPKHPIGSGPFMLTSYTAGQRASFKRFDSYWVHGQPYVDELEFIGFADGTSQVNGLIGGQADAAPDLDPSVMRVVTGAGSSYKVDVSPSSATLTWPMHCGKPPFNDVRVRQALRLAVDRTQLISQVYAGKARLANDYFGPYDSGYDRAIPQREQDIDKAKSLLKAAGHSSVSIQLTGAPILPSANHQNEVLVQQVKQAGFNVSFRQVDEATFYGSAYGTYPLSLSLWGSLNILDQSALTIVKGSPYDATHWQDADYNKLFNQAQRQPNQAKRNDLLHAMQQISYDRGSYLVTQFHDYVTGYSSKVTGYKPYPNSEAGSDFRYREMWFTA